LTAPRSALMLCPLGVLLGGTNEAHRIARHGGAGTRKNYSFCEHKTCLSTKGTDVHAPWIRNVNDFKRRERREFQVSRYG
jgi:hypothetical protein